MIVTVGDAVQTAFLPVLAPLGYVLAESTDDGATFESPLVVVAARYVPRDGELAVYVAPKDGGQRVQLLLYLRAIQSDAAARLGPAVAESEADAAKLAVLFAAGLSDAETLLRAESHAVRKARDLRWWNADEAGELT